MPSLGLGLSLSLGLFLIGLLSSTYATEVKIDSPDHNKTWPTSRLVDRDLRWNEKKQTLFAVLTFLDELHSDESAPSQQDTLFFSFPGVRLDPDGHTLSVQAEDGTSIPFASWLSGTFGHRVILDRNALLFIGRTHGTVKLTLDVDTERTDADLPKNHADETETLPLDQALQKH